MSDVVLAGLWRDGQMHGWGWGMAIGWLIVLILIVVLLVVVVRHLTSSGVRGGSSAHDVLAERYARGEIDEEEYRKRRATLRE